MSVIVTLRMRGNGKAIEQEDKALLQTISERAKGYGVIFHRFYGSDDEILIVDEWPSAESFQAFFAASPEVPGVMERAGVTAEPEITFWRKLDTGDDVG